MTGIIRRMYTVLRTCCGLNRQKVSFIVPSLLVCGWSKKRRHDGTDDGTPVGRYATGHCPVVVDVRRTHDGTLARGVVQATGQTMRHVELPVVMWFVITFLT